MLVAFFAAMILTIVFGYEKTINTPKSESNGVTSGET